MKYTNIYVLIPFYNDSLKDWIKLHLEGTLDKRRLKREVRKYCQRAFNKQVPNTFIYNDCLYVQQFDPTGVDPEKLQKGIGAMTTFLQDEHQEIEQAESNQGTQVLHS